MNGLIFPEDNFPGDAAGAAAVDEMDGLLALGGGGGGAETTGAATTGASMFRLRCSSKSPTYEKFHNIQSNIRRNHKTFSFRTYQKIIFLKKYLELYFFSTKKE